MKSFYYIIAFFTLLLYFTNCYYSSSSGGGGGSEPVITPDIETIKWESNEDTIQFYTNNPFEIDNETGATFWNPKSYKGAGLAEDMVEAIVCKMSGLTGYGYGLIFCIQDNPDNGEFIAKNFYCVLIRTDGFFQIIKAVEHPTEPDTAPLQHIMDIGGNVSGWKEALDINGDNVIDKGKGVDNIIRVEITDPDSNDL